MVGTSALRRRSLSFSNRITAVCFPRVWIRAFLILLWCSEQGEHQEIPAGFWSTPESTRDLVSGNVVFFQIVELTLLSVHAEELRRVYRAQQRIFVNDLLSFLDCPACPTPRSFLLLTPE